MSGLRLNRIARNVCASPIPAEPTPMVPEQPHVTEIEPEVPELPQRDPRFTLSGGTAMVHIPQITSRATQANPQMPAMGANESERNSMTWLEDFGGSAVPGKEMTAGLFRMNAGPALEYVYTYEEMKLIVEGEFHLTDGTGQQVVAKAGDLMYFPKGSRITFATPETGLGYFCGQRAWGTGDYVEPVTDPELKAALASNPQMVHFPRATKLPLPKMEANVTERDSETYLGDIACSTVPGRELASGLYRMNAGKPLEYYYDYEEMKYIVEGEFHLTDGTGQKVVAKAGDLMYFPRGSSIVFDTPQTALGFFCGQRLVDVPVNGAGDYGQARMEPMLFAGKFEEDPIPLTFLDPDRPMDGRRMGLKTLDLEKRWLMIDSTYEEQMRLKQPLLDDHPEEIVVTEEDATPEEAAKTLAAKRETLRLVVDHLLRHNPEIFERRENGVVRNKLLGEDVLVEGAEEDPLLTACRLIQEDLCLVEPIGEDRNNVRVSCGVVYFPMRWSLKQKVGRKLLAVHGPVTAFQKHYLKSAHSFFGTLKAEAPISRGNWAVFDDLFSTDDLYQPMSSVKRAKDYPKPTNLAEAGSKYFYRAEYQTLRRLPETGAVLFTIRTYQLPLERFAQYPYEASMLASRIRTLDPDMAEYKNADSWKDWALRYLDSIADANAPAQGSA